MFLEDAYLNPSFTVIIIPYITIQHSLTQSLHLFKNIFLLYWKLQYLIKLGRPTFYRYRWKSIYQTNSVEEANRRYLTTDLETTNTSNFWYIQTQLKIIIKRNAIEYYIFTLQNAIFTLYIKSMLKSYSWSWRRSFKFNKGLTNFTRFSSTFNRLSLL